MEVKLSNEELTNLASLTLYLRSAFGEAATPGVTLSTILSWANTKLVKEGILKVSNDYDAKLIIIFSDYERRFNVA